MKKHLRRLFLVAVGLTAITQIPASRALAQPPSQCPTEMEAGKVRAFYEENRTTLPISAVRQLRLPEMKITASLPSTIANGTSGSAFSRVWGKLEGLQKVTIMIVVEGSLFEVHSDIPAGVPSKRSSFFNLAPGNALGGHLNPQSIHAIYSLHLPMERDDMYAIIFYNELGQQAFGFYLAGEGRKASEEEILRFREIEALIKSSASICSDQEIN